MRKIKVKDIMVPLKDYATVHQDSFLSEAILALEKAQEEHDTRHYKHRAVLVYDDSKKIVGKLSQLDVIKSLEPKYKNFGNLTHASLSGFSLDFMRSMLDKHNLWQGDLETICVRVANKKVKDAMYIPTEGEMVDVDATLGEALHAFIIGHHQGLLVTKNGDIVGILRLTDVFKLVDERIKSCKF